MPIAVTSFGTASKTTLTRTQRRTELRTQLRDGETNTLWTDTALNSALNEALALTQSRYPVLRRVGILATGGRAYALPSDCMGVRRVWVQDGSTGTNARPPQEQTGWIVTKGFDTDYVTQTANAFDSVLVLAGNEPTGHTILVVYAPIPPDWGSSSATTYDDLAIDLAPDEGTDRYAELLFYAAARTAAYRWAMAQLAGAGSEDYGREYTAAVQERERIMALITGPRETVNFTTGIFG